MEKQLIRIKVSDLVPYYRNPRKIPQEAVDDVRESFRQCGVIDPIEIDENNVILSGHSRRLAAIAEGIKEVDALRITGLQEKTKRKYRLLANKAGEKTGWDYEILAEEIDDLESFVPEQMSLEELTRFKKKLDATLKAMKIQERVNRERMDLLRDMIDETDFTIEDKS